MTENFIKIRNSAPVIDEYAQEQDKKKAYQIFALSGIGSVILTTIMYVASQFFLESNLL